MTLMMPVDLQELIAAGETFTVEFKRGRINDDELVETVVCLANGDGGLVLLGVEDDGRVTGVKPRHGSSTSAQRLQTMILNRTEGPVATEVQIVPQDSVEVVVITVPRSEVPVGTKSGKFVRRALQVGGKPECRPYPLHELLSAGLTALERDYAGTLAAGATHQDLDPAEFDRFRRLCATSRGDAALVDASDPEVLRGLRLLLPGQQQLTLGAILLFGRPEALERFVPTSEVVFHELSRGVLIASEVLRLPLFAAAERVYQLVSLRNQQQEILIGLHRVGISRVSDQVVREAVANALVHRDYSELGPVQVQLTDTQFRVSSPGGFPRGITLDNLLEDSRPRSPILADAFRRAGIVDRVGRGVGLMYRELLRQGRGEPDYGSSNEHTVAVSIPASDADLDMVRFVIDFETLTQTTLTLTQLRLLHELKASGPQSPTELAEGLVITTSDARSNLVRLAEQGLVAIRGSTRNRRYHLTPDFYRLANPSDYVRLQEWSPIQQQQMVLTYIDQFGSITRRKAAELCRIQPTQASGLLQQMVRAGELQLHGQRRGAHYKRAERTTDPRNQ